MQVKIGSLAIGDGAPLAIVAGPCVLESIEICREIAEGIADAAAAVEMPWIFKGSFDKANRTSINSYRGPGLQEGLTMLDKVKSDFKVPVQTDIHEVSQVAEVAKVVDVLQIPAFLCRQTDLVVTAARTGKAVMLKKGQFVAPEDMQQAKQKTFDAGNQQVMLCERGTSFGYHRLVVDMRSLQIMRKMGCPVVLDVTHSVQLPGEAGTSSAGEPEFIPAIARAGAAVGIDAIFIEVHPRPEAAKSDAATSWPLSKLTDLLKQIKAVDQCLRSLTK